MSVPRVKKRGLEEEVVEEVEEEGEGCPSRSQT